MKITLFDKNNNIFINEAALLLAKTFPHSYADSGMDEMKEILDSERITVMAVVDGHLIGLAGAIPQYGMTGWELHPLVVDENYRNQNIGSSLVALLVAEVKKLGGLVIYLGTDDEFNQTSLSMEDLFDDPYTKINNIKNLKNHPYSFYEKLGFIICGVIPDANGKGKPDIIMAKRIS